MNQRVNGGTDADVQGAVDRAEIGGEVVLSGTFNFGSGTVTVTKAITIRALQASDMPKPVRPIKIPKEDDGSTLLTTLFNPIIIGGGGVTGTQAYPAFEIKASGVTIQHLHFQGPQAIAIRAAEVNGVIIRDCKIEQLQVPIGLTTGSAIIVGTMFPNPRTAFGDIQVVGNEIDTLGGPSVGTVGILFNQAGISQAGTTPDQAAHIFVQGNTVKSVTGFGIDFRDLKGHATVVENTIDMGTVGNQAVKYPSGIRCFGSSPKDPCEGQYELVKNDITCGFDRAAGIRLYSASTFARLEGAKVSGNSITMLTARLDELNAGIEIRGINIGAGVSHNTIQGQARAALSVIKDPIGAPVDTQLTENHHEKFHFLLADITISTGVKNTKVTATEGQTGKIQDFGDHTECPVTYDRI